MVFTADILICLFSVSLAYMLRFNFTIPETDLRSLPFVIPFVLVIRAVSFIIGRTYAGIIRYTSTQDAERIFIAVLAGSIFFALSNIFSFYLINDKYVIPFSIIIIDFITTTFLMTAIRLIIKILYMELWNPTKEKANVIIYGTDEFGIITKRTLDRDAGTKLKVAAFIDNTSRNVGKKLEGVTIHNSDDLDELLKKHDISTLIIAKKVVGGARKREMIETCLRHNVSVLTVPEVNRWINGELSYKQIKEVRIEDLLEREPIQLDKEKIRAQTLNKVILVTGAAGSIGSELVRQLTLFGPGKIILFDQAESPLYDIELDLTEQYNYHDYEAIIGDIRDEAKVEHIMKKYSPDIVFHAAAYKHVPIMESHPYEAVYTNVLGTKITADMAVKYNVDKFIMISTDKAVNPTNIMGASKRIAEIYIQSLKKNSATNFITTRFGNVLGSNGSVIPRFKKQIESGGPVTITHPDVTRFFMTIPEACQLVLEASTMGHGGEIYIFDMGDSVKVLDLAKKMIMLSGLTLGKDIHISHTGLRPGEKLYEELLNKEENTTATHHDQIMIARVNEYDHDTVSETITKLLKTMKTHDEEDIVRIMKEMVPEFKSQNSKFEKLD